MGADEAGDRDWRLGEWMRHCGKRQADMVDELGWSRGRASKVCAGALPYKRDEVNLLAGWLGIRPCELLMGPEEALAIRRLRETAKLIASWD